MPTTTSPPASAATPRIGFVLEQTLGHRTHASNLQAVVEDDDLRACWLPVPWPAAGLAAAVPLYGSNWTVRAGVRARRAVGRAHRSRPLDALFVHTQVPGVLLGGWMRRIPTVVSLDATPRQYDALGSSYHHHQGGRRSEALKWRMNRRCFERAAALITWSEWARQGLVDDYGVAPDKVTVIPPGVRVTEWLRPAGASPTASAVRVLFVGGDFRRKGGALLLEAARCLRDEGAGGEAGFVVDVVTQGDVPPTEGVTVHRDLRPNSTQLRRLYHEADIFCLPTFGDCLPMVLAEAGAAGLPLVATAVGAIPELVRDDRTGTLVPVGDAAALTVALRGLIEDDGRRRRLGHGAQQLVRRDHDAEVNAGRLLSLLRAVARRDAAGEPPSAMAATRPQRGDR